MINFINLLGFDNFQCSTRTNKLNSHLFLKEYIFIFYRKCKSYKTSYNKISKFSKNAK